MTRLAIAAVLAIGLYAALWRVLRHRIRQANANRPRPDTRGGRHRVGRSYSPLSPAVRQSIAPTAYENVALHAGPEEMTGRLRAPGGAA